MADENLSFQIVFDEVEKLTQEVSRAGKSIESLGEFGREAGRGIDVAAQSAVEAAEAILGIDSAARQAAAAVDELTTPRDIAVDTSEIEDALVASERLRAEIEEFAAPQSIAIDFTGLDEANRAFEESFAAAQNLRSEIEEFDAAKTAVDGVTSSVDKLGESLDNAANRADQSVGAIGGSFGKIGTSIAGIAKAAGAAALGFAAFKSVEQIGQAIAGSMRTAVREFVEAERATVNLTAALGSIGQFSTENAAAVRAFADEIARTTTFEDDAVVSAAALIAQLGRLSGTELTGATQSAVQLAAVLGKDLQSAALLVARAAAGSTEALSRYGIILDDSVKPAERFAEVQRQITERFGGRAQADLLTFGGSVQQLRKSWNELLESFGRTITIFQPAINALTAGFEKLNDLMGVETPQNALDARQALESVGDAIDKLGERRATDRPFNVSDLIGLSPGEAPPDLTAPLRDALKEIGDAEVAIRFTVTGGNTEQIEATRKELALLREVADDAGQIEIVAELERLQSLIPIGPLFDKSTIDQAEEATRGVQVLIDLLARTQTIAGAEPIDLIETSKLEADTTTVEDLRPRLIEAINAMEAAVGRAAAPGAINPAGPALELFRAFQDAREKFLAEFETIPPAIEAIFQDGLRRAETVAQRFGSLDLTLPPLELKIEARPDDLVNPLRQIGDAAEDAQAKLDELAEFAPNLNSAFVEIGESARGFQDALTTGFEFALTSILDQTANFRSVMVGIFKSLVDEAIKQLARLAALKVFETVLNIFAPGAGTVVPLVFGTPKITPPGPVDVPIIPDTSGARKAIDDQIRGIRLPSLDPIVVPVETDIGDALAAIQAIQLPTIDSPTVTLGLDTSVLDDIRLPSLDPLVTAVEFDVPTLGDLTAAVDLQVPGLEPITADVVLNVPTLDPLQTEIQFEAPTVDPILAALEFAAPQLDALSVPVAFDFPALEPLSLEAAIQLQEFDLPDLEPLSVALSVGRLPELEPQAVAVAADFDQSAFARQLDEPSFDIGASFRRPEFEVSDSSTLAFSRFIQSARAPRPPAPPPASVRDVIPRPVNIQITGAVNDGISVRRQLTSGALRTELERSLRRST